MKFSKVIDLEDFHSNELTPYLQSIAEIEMAFFGIKKPVIVPDSKNWETAMALYSFEKHHMLQKNKLFAGIGAGTERLTELLANKGAVVFPVDRYLESTPWSDVAPSGYMIDVSEYTSKGTDSKNIIPVHSDGREIALPSNFFDGVYSSGSIEHFGGLDAVEATAIEIARILKPGGIASISTEFRLDGPAEIPWFDNSCILFTPELITKHIVEPSGLIGMEIPNNQPSPSTFKTRKNLVNFLDSVKNIHTFQDKMETYPNLILFHQGFLFCSVHILLKKPLDWRPNPGAASKVSRFHEEIRTNNLKAINDIKKIYSQSILLQRERKGIKWLFNVLYKLISILKKNPLVERFITRILFKFPKLKSLLRKKLKSYEII